jgi:hypothetical protein
MADFSETQAKYPSLSISTGTTPFSFNLCIFLRWFLNFVDFLPSFGRVPDATGGPLGRHGSFCGGSGELDELDELGELDDLGEATFFCGSGELDELDELDELGELDELEEQT